jgi:hypothetical protein
MWKEDQGNKPRSFFFLLYKVLDFKGFHCFIDKNEAFFLGVSKMDYG